MQQSNINSSYQSSSFKNLNYEHTTNTNNTLLFNTEEIKEQETQANHSKTSSRLIADFNSHKPVLVTMLHQAAPISAFDSKKLEETSLIRKEAFNCGNDEACNFSASIISSRFKKNNLYFSEAKTLQYGLVLNETNMLIQNSLPMGMGTKNYRHNNEAKTVGESGVYAKNNKAYTHKRFGILHNKDEWFKQDSRDKAFSVVNDNLESKTNNTNILLQTSKHITKHWDKTTQHGINEVLFLPKDNFLDSIDGIIINLPKCNNDPIEFINSSYTKDEINELNKLAKTLNKPILGLYSNQLVAIKLEELQFNLVEAEYKKGIEAISTLFLENINDSITNWATDANGPQDFKLQLESLIRQCPSKELVSILHSTEKEKCPLTSILEISNQEYRKLMLDSFITTILDANIDIDKKVQLLTPHKQVENLEELRDDYLSSIRELARDRNLFSLPFNVMKNLYNE